MFQVTIKDSRGMIIKVERFNDEYEAWAFMDNNEVRFVCEFENLEDEPNERCE